MRIFRANILILIPLLFASACVFKLPTVQGNVLDKDDINKLEVGMSSNQVRYTLGTPLLEDPFDPRRWDYVYYYRSPEGEITQRTISLYFEGETLASIQRSGTENIEITDELVEEAEAEAKENLPAERPDKKDRPAGYEKDPFEGSDPNVDRRPEG